jgi:uncharacterized repeat protein (TIGR01451 family)
MESTMTRKLLAGLLLTIASVIAFGSSLPLDAALNDTILVSRQSLTATQGNGDSSGPAMSADGRYIAFASAATNLDPTATDSNVSADIFRRDVQTGTTILISRIPASNTAASGGTSSSGATISADGNCIAFTSNQTNLLSVAVPGGYNVYLRNVVAGTTVLINRQNGVAGTAINGNGAFEGFVNANCTFVAFNCSSCNTITPSESSGTNQVFVRDVANNLTERVSLKDGVIVDAAGQQGNSASGHPSLSADGNLVAFQSSATDLNPGQTVAANQIWLRNRSAHTTTLVSQSTGGVAGSDTGHQSPMISADGSSVVWETNSQLLVPNTLVATQVVNWTVNASGTLTSNPVFTSPTSATCTVNIQCFFYANAVSSDIVDSVTCAGCPLTFFDQGSTGWILGTPVAVGPFPAATFTANDGSAPTTNQGFTLNVAAAPASGLPAFTSPASATFTQTQQGYFAVNVTRSDVAITCGTAGTQVPATAGNCSGTLPTGLTTQISGTCNCNAIISGTPSVNGAFQTTFKAAVIINNIFMRKLNTNTTSQVNLRSGTGAQGLHLATQPSVSADGRYVAFMSQGFDDLVPGAGSNTRTDVFLRDTVAGTTEIINLANGGTTQALPGTSISSTFDSSGTPDGPFSKVPQLISTDGRYVAFSSDATNLLTPEGDTSDKDVFRRQKLADPPGTLIVHKDFSDGNISNVSISVTCGGGAAPASSPLNARDNPDTPATFTINGANGGTCTATETVPAGYTPNQAGCANVVVSSGATVECTIINTLNTATLRVHKDFSDGNTSNVAMSVTCTGGAAAAVSPLNARDNPDTPAVFTINLVPSGGTDCTATEATPGGYTPDQSNCAIVNLMPGANVNCTITNAPLAASSATLTVHKDFTDTNASNVTMAVTCTGGATPAFSPLSAHDNPDTPAVFTINNVPVAGTSCTATETTPAGYTQSATTCTSVVLTAGGAGSCTITNAPTGGAGTPDLSIVKTHAGTLVQGQIGAPYTITVTNSGSAPTSGPVTVTDVLPAGLIAISIAGSGWNCTQPAGPCTRSDVLAAGASHPSITLMVSVAVNAPPSVTNIASVSGGGQANITNDMSSDAATVISAAQAASGLPNPPLGASFGAILEAGSRATATPVTVRPASAAASGGAVSAIQPPNTGDAGLLPE